MEFDELSQLAYKYGTDKCPQLNHTYTPFYYSLLKDKKNSIKKVIEAGIGYWPGMKATDETSYDKQLGRLYYKGASLKMWRDFFPNAQIYGFDRKYETVFEDERIKTFAFDERSQRHMRRLISITGSDIDLFIDDAIHYPEAQTNLCKYIMPMVKKDVIYVIEDVSRKDLETIANALSEYSIEIPTLEPPIKVLRQKPTYLIVVRNK